MEFASSKLDNGLTIVTEVNPAARSMAAGFFVKTGSRDETPDVAGVSHFLEHMVFKGTDRRSAFDVNLDFDRLGAHYNAFTSEENTVFYGWVLPEHQTRLLDLLCDILRPALREEDFSVEKNVILDEIARYEDQPRFRVYDKLMAAHFAGHPLGNSILGAKESIAALNRQQMKEYFDRRYSPGNITVVGVGNLDRQVFVDKVSELCGDWSSFQTSRQTPLPRPDGARRIIHDPKVLREHMALMSGAPPHQSADRFAAELLAAIVGDDAGSRLFYALIEPGIADEASMSYAPMDQAGGWMTFISTDADKAAEAIGIAAKVLDDFARTGPQERELQAAKNKIASEATLRGELPMGRLSAVGFDWIYCGEYMPLSKQIEALFAVSREDVHQLARKHDLPRATLVALGPADQL